MITNTGKRILSKYLVGQINTYASHISIGCGSKPLADADAHDTASYAVKPVMDFEMLRLPIISRGYVTESTLFSTTGTIGTVTGSGVAYAAPITNISSTTNLLVGQVITATTGTGSLGSGTVKVASITNVTAITVTSTASMTAGTITNLSKPTEKVSLTAEMPSLERYEITEVGVWSNEKNPIAGSNDSRVLFSFSEQENWKYHSTTTTDIISSTFDATAGNVNTLTTSTTFRINADDPFFDNSFRKTRYERPRYLNSGIIINANIAPNMTSTNSIFKLGTNDTHIHLSVPNGITFDNNTSEDQIKLTYSIIRANAADSAPNPLDLKILVEFIYDEDSTTTEYANMQIQITESNISGNSGNSYFVATKKISELATSSAFSWSKVRWIRISTKGPSSYYVNLDALRFENLSDIIANPNYGMVGYTKVKDGTPGVSIVKENNFSGNVEFRFVIDVGDA